MTKKDYQMIAEVIASVPNATIGRELMTGWVSRRLLVGRLASRLAEDNPRFNREKFVIACGLRLRYGGQ